MADPTPAAQTPESTCLPADLFHKAQDAATEKGRPIYVYRAERAGRFTSKWDPVEGATPAAVIQPREPAEPPAPVAAPTVDLDDPGQGPSDGALDAPAGVRAAEPAGRSRGGNSVTLYTAGGQLVEWDGVTDVVVEDGGRIVHFRDVDGAVRRVLVGGGSVSIGTHDRRHA